VHLRKPVIFSTSVLSVAHRILLLNYHFDAARPIPSTSVVVSLAFLQYSQSLVSPPLFRASTLDEISRILCATEVALGFSGWNHLAWRGSNLKTHGAVLRNTEVTDAGNPAIDGKLLRRVIGRLVPHILCSHSCFLWSGSHA
jgi:hypothetical protein